DYYCQVYHGCANVLF
nr:immunoglobulin light chain junction region [Macaca mulatta]